MTGTRLEGFGLSLTLALGVLALSNCTKPCDGPNAPPECQPCSGCIVDGQCMPGTSATACGVGGGACTSCEASAVCRRDGTCGADYDGEWAVAVSSMILLNQDATGAALDPDGNPDTSSFLYCPHTSRLAYQSLQAVGISPAHRGPTGLVKCTATFEELTKLGIALRLSEDSRFVTPRYLITFTEEQLRAGTVTLGPFAPSISTVTFVIEKQ